MSVTEPKGWLAAGVQAGTKNSDDLDLALICSERDATVAGAFTTNRLLGAPVLVSRPRAAAGSARGVVCSAGVANVATGEEGVEDAREMARVAAEACDVPEHEMLVACTGRIGPRLAMDRILPGIRTAADGLDPDGGEAAAGAILTTDTRIKVVSRTIEVSGTTVTVGGIAKGAGMIAPQMETAHATMFAFLTTDGAADAAALRDILGSGLPGSFNGVRVDGQMSTSDTALLFANGAAGVQVGGSADFRAAVHEVMHELAHSIAADAEGATKLVRISVQGAASDDEARTAVREVADSVLVRAALWGRDPAWGRVLQAVGQSQGIVLDPDRTRISFSGVELAAGGVSTGREEEAAKALDGAEITIDIDLGLGLGSSQCLTCDLSPEYVEINGHYET